MNPLLWELVNIPREAANMNTVYDKNTNAGRKGFTLIELLVVVLIIGILTSISIPQYFKTVEKTRLTEVYSVATAVKSAQMRYQTGTGAYASDLNKLDISYTNLSTALITLRYFNASLAVTDGTSYTLTMTRTTTNARVAALFGKYSVMTRFPTTQTFTVSDCPGLNEDACAYLLN